MQSTYTDVACLQFSMLGGSIAIPVSLFWMAWTSRPDISIWSPLGASVLFGYGILCIFITRFVLNDPPSPTSLVGA